MIDFALVERSPQLHVGTGIITDLGAHIVIEFLHGICVQDPRRKRRDKWLKETGGQ